MSSSDELVEYQNAINILRSWHLEYPCDEDGVKLNDAIMAASPAKIVEETLKGYDRLKEDLYNAKAELQQLRQEVKA